MEYLDFSVSDWHRTGQVKISGACAEPCFSSFGVADKRTAWVGTYGSSLASSRLYQTNVARGKQPGPFPDQEI